MCNCGCDPAWPHSPAGDPNATQGIGCVTGGGEFTTTPLACTNYWSPTDLGPGHVRTNDKCSVAAAATLEGCVGNLTRKITGDDSAEILDQFEVRGSAWARRVVVWLREGGWSVVSGQVAVSGQWSVVVWLRGWSVVSGP